MYQYDDPTAVSVLPTPAAAGTAGYFTDGNPASSAPATILRSDFMNMLMMELLNVVQAAGISPQKTSYTQVLLAIQKMQQTQAAVAFAAGGTAPAYTLTPAPAITTYANNPRFNVTFGTAGTTGSNTINISSLGAIPIKQFAADGSLVSGIVTAGMNSDVQIVGAGSYALLLDPLPGTAIGVRGVRSNLSISYTGTSGVVSVSANELSLESASGAYVTLKNISLSATSGNSSGAANSLDTGSWAYSTWYNLFVIYNPTTQTSALLWSLSATAPTMPSGYTYFARIGANKTQSATSYFFLGGNQRDKTFRYLLAPGSNVTSIPLMASGAAGSISTPTWVSVATGSFVPATAPIIAIGGMSAAGATIMVAPSASYGALGSLTITAPYVVSATSGTTPNNSVTNITLESTSLYWCNNSASSSLFCFGWEDNL